MCKKSSKTAPQLRHLMPITSSLIRELIGKYEDSVWRSSRNFIVVGKLNSRIRDTTFDKQSMEKEKPCFRYFARKVLCLGISYPEKVLFITFPMPSLVPIQDLIASEFSSVSECLIECFLRQWPLSTTCLCKTAMSISN